MVVGVDVDVLCICINKMEKTYNFHPACTNKCDDVQCTRIQTKTVLQHYYHERVCVHRQYTYVLVYVRLDPYCMMGYIWGVHFLNKPVW